MNPYTDRPETAFWRPAVADKSPFEISGLWSPAFEIRKETRICTYGSCFAQHIGNALRKRGFAWVNAEPAPDGLPPEMHREFNFEIFSARTGNIYTAGMLRQWAEWSFAGVAVPDEVWEEDGHFFDPFRPAIEPGGFETPEEMLGARAHSIDRFRASIEGSDVLLFTLGLTERWCNAHHGYEYAICPGTLAGTFDPSAHILDNMGYEAIFADICRTLELIRGVNPALKVLLTVSPVPITATATDQHALVATTRTKSTLRAVASGLQERFDYVDYFPSYEIIVGTPFRGAFYEPNMRSVSKAGVDFVMSHFLGAIGEPSGQDAAKPDAREAEADTETELVCEEEILDAFRGE